MSRAKFIVCGTIMECIAELHVLEVGPVEAKKAWQEHFGGLINPSWKVEIYQEGEAGFDIIPFQDGFSVWSGGYQYAE